MKSLLKWIGQYLPIFVLCLCVAAWPASTTASDDSSSDSSSSDSSSSDSSSDDSSSDDDGGSSSIGNCECDPVIIAALLSTDDSSSDDSSSDDSSSDDSSSSDSSSDGDGGPSVYYEACTCPDNSKGIFPPGPSSGPTTGPGSLTPNKSFREILGK